jgi:hypothetical protein
MKVHARVIHSQVVRSMTQPPASRTESQRRATVRFFYPPDEASFFASYDALQHTTPSVRRAADNFRHALRGVMITASMPFQMVHESVTRRRFQAIHTAERIRASADMVESGSESDLTLELEERALLKARARLAEELATPAGMEQIVDAVLEELGHHLDSASFSEAADELLREATSLTWTSTEVLIQSLHRLGCAQHKRVRAALQDLDPGVGDGPTIMRRHDVWVLFQRRHLIQHRASVVDSQYLAATGDPVPLGSTLQVSPKHLEHYLARACGLAMHLLRLPESPQLSSLE